MYPQIIIIPAYEPDQRLIRYVDQLLYAGFEKLIIVDDGAVMYLKIPAPLQRA
jgi:hypothetical protein